MLDITVERYRQSRTGVMTGVDYLYRPHFLLKGEIMLKNTWYVHIVDEIYIPVPLLLGQNKTPYGVLADILMLGHKHVNFEQKVEGEYIIQNIVYWDEKSEKCVELRFKKRNLFKN